MNVPLTTTTLAWSCTGVALAFLIVMGLPGAIRRLLSRVEGFALTLAIASLIGFLGLILDASVDSGLRIHLPASASSVSATVYGEVAYASRPFSIDTYYTLNRRLISQPHVAGSVPETVTRLTWRDIRTDTSFTASLLGEGFGHGNVRRSPVASDFTVLRSVGGRRLALSHLHGSNSFVTESEANANDLRVGDELFTRIHSQAVFVRIADVVPEGQLLTTTPGIIMPLATVQQLFGSVGDASSLVVAYVATPQSGHEKLPSRLNSLIDSAIPIRRVKAVTWRRAIALSVRTHRDWTGWISILGMALVIVCSLTLYFIGRSKAVPRGQR